MSPKDKRDAPSVLIDDDGTERDLMLAKDTMTARISVLMRGGFGVRIYVVTGETDAKGRRVLRSRLH